MADAKSLHKVRSTKSKLCINSIIYFRFVVEKIALSLTIQNSTHFLGWNLASTNFWYNDINLKFEHNGSDVFVCLLFFYPAFLFSISLAIAVVDLSFSDVYRS